MFYLGPTCSPRDGEYDDVFYMEDVIDLPISKMLVWTR